MGDELRMKSWKFLQMISNNWMNHRPLEAQLKEISWTGVSQALCALPLAAMGYVGVAQRIFLGFAWFWFPRGMLNHLGVPKLAE